VNAAALLRLEQVACIRGGRLLFEELDLVLQPGEAVVATGPNGAGKSSLLRLAGGLLRAAAGHVERPGPAALADESLALDGKLSLGHALSFWAKIDGTDAAAGMSAMGLTALADVPVRMLSAGQRKRAVLARVIASGAALWLLDEPTNGLDTDGLERLNTAMAAHRADGGAILAASHQPLVLPGAREVALG
jgi:heme exporter protein A